MPFNKSLSDFFCHIKFFFPKRHPERFSPTGIVLSPKFCIFRVNLCRKIIFQ